MSTSRPAVPFRGVFYAKGAIIHARGRGMALDTPMPVTADRPMIKAERDRMATQPRRDDRITRSANGRIYVVTSITYEEDRYLRLWLNEC